MLVTYETTPLPLVGQERDFAHANELLAAVLAGEIGGLCMPHAYLEGDVYTAYREQFGNTLAEHGFSLESQIFATTLTRQGDRYDAAEILHHDDLVSPEDPAVTAVNFHYTTRGVVRAEFFHAQSGFYDGPDSLTHANFRRGKLDDQLVEPHGFHALSAAGALIVFAAHGSRSLVHAFTTLEAPRSSFLATAYRQGYGL